MTPDDQGAAGSDYTANLDPIAEEPEAVVIVSYFPSPVHVTYMLVVNHVDDIHPSSGSAL